MRRERTSRLSVMGMAGCRWQVGGRGRGREGGREGEQEKRERAENIGRGGYTRTHMNMSGEEGITKLPGHFTESMYVHMP